MRTDSGFGNWEYAEISRESLKYAKTRSDLHFADLGILSPQNTELTKFWEFCLRVATALQGGCYRGEIC